MTEPKKPRNGNYTRNRGYRFEAEFVKFMNDGGVPARRHLMSGMHEKGDCTLTPARFRKLLGQNKRVKALPKWIGFDGHDFAAVREDRGSTFIICAADLFLELLRDSDAARSAETEGLGSPSGPASAGPKDIAK